MKLAKYQQDAWRGNRRLLPTEPDGMQVGDLVVFLNMPVHGVWSIARVTGGYRFEISDMPNTVNGAQDYGHIREVELITDRRGVDPSREAVSDGLRRSMRPISRMWRIDGHGEEIGRLGGFADHGSTERVADRTPARSHQLQPLPSRERETGAWSASASRPLSPAFEAAYDRLLQHLGSRWQGMPDRVCVHWPMHEPSYTGRLLVIGQALNGWMHVVAPRDFRDPEVRVRLLSETRETSERDGAFGWMRKVVWSRPFWRLARVVMDRMDLKLNQIAWSNLAPVAPGDGGNPVGELLERQHRLGGELLRRQVQELDPDLVLVVSGRAYAEPFLRGAGLEPAWVRRGAMQADDRLDGRRWIVVNHPAPSPAVSMRRAKR